MNDDLPTGWAPTTIGDVAEVQLGRQRSPQHHAGEQMRPYLRSANVTWLGIDVNDVNQMNFDDADFDKYKLDPGDLLLNEASGSPSEVGKPAIWKGEIEDCCFQNTLLRLRPSVINRTYLYWYCYRSALIGQFGAAGRGVNIRHLGKRGLAEFPIPVAPRSEQERIVAAIEEHLCRLDFAESALEAARSKLQALRRSVLAAAFSGRLTNPPPTTNTDPGQLPGGWRLASIADVAEVNLGRQRSPPHHTGEQMRPYLRAANVTWEGISLEDVKTMNFDDADFDRFRLTRGDILLNEASGSPNEVGKPAVWDGEIEDCCFQNTLLRLRPRDLNAGYLYWYCYSSALSGRFGEAGRGVNIRHLGKRGLAQFPIPLGPRAEQERVVAAIEESLSRLDAAEACLDAVRAKMAAFRRSVLAEAFAGRLVPQDPDDEPAAALLTRTAAEHPVRPTSRKKPA